MTENIAQAGPVGQLRVLDLTDKRGWLAGRILADLGADVVKIEPPGGDSARVDPRLIAGIESRGANPAWLALNRGKKSATLDLDSSAGRDLLLALIPETDVVLESFSPGTMAAYGLAYDDLAAVNPAVVLTSISPFGQTGPYAQWASADIVVGSMGGAVWLAGDPDRPPARIGADQYFLHASAEAALHSLAAYHYAAQTGRGQHVDVSAQLATIRTLMNAAQMPHTDGTVADRSTFGEPTPQQPYIRLFPCADGYVMISPTFAPAPWAILEWMRDADCLPDALTHVTREQLAGRADEIIERLPEFPGELSAALAQFFAHRTKATLAHEALARRLMLVPINNVADLMADEQLTDRGYFTEVVYDGIGTLATPSNWVKMSATPLVTATGTASPGQHNADIWCGRAGLTAVDLAAHRNAKMI